MVFSLHGVQPADNHDSFCSFLSVLQRHAGRAADFDVSGESAVPALLLLFRAVLPAKVDLISDGTCAAQQDDSADEEDG